MLPHLFRSFLPFYAIAIYFSISISTTSHAVEHYDRYDNCSTTFSCANIKNISYPFWGQNRPQYCGHPSFRLDCSGEAPVIKIMSLSYRILDINLRQRSFVVVQTDYWDSFCPKIYYNITTDSSIFSLSSDNHNLTIYYVCPWVTPKALASSIAKNSFNCSVTKIPIVAYWTKNINDPSMVPLLKEYLSSCTFSVFIPVARSAAWRLNSLRPLLHSGFRLEWDANNVLCSRCTASGGKCGQDLGQFSCFCRHGSYPTTCSAGKDSKKGRTIGIAVGCFAAVGGLLCAAYLLVWRRKQLIIAQSTTKDVGGGSGPPLSSNDANGIRPLALPFIASPTTPSSNYYGSTPSYYGDAKSDLENGSTYNGVRIFSYDELEEATENFDGSKELGDGGFGVVYHGKLRDGRSVAVKRLYERNFKRVEQFMNEVEILTRLRHPNLVTLYGCTSRRSRELLLVYEFISNGTLADHLHGTKASSGALAWPVRLSVAIETADALAYLHASEIIHRDVKTNNILLDQNFHVKVADFGLSRLYPNDVTHVSTAPQGTPGYVDPEYYQCYHLTSRSDVYSFGVVLVELVSSKQAVDTSRHRHDVNLANMAVIKIQNQSLHELVDPWLGYDGDCEVRQAVKAVAELAFRCLQQERDMRPSMDEVLEGLKMIETEYNDQMKQKNKEFVKINEDGTQEDDAVPLKRNATATLSPDSVVNAKWSSSSITQGSQ